MRGRKNLRPTRREEPRVWIAAVLQAPEVPPNEAASAPAEGLATGVTAQNEEATGGQHDHTVAVVAAVGESGGLAPIC